MRYDIDGACVLLSGASSGIGLELARTLVRDHGCRVIGIARREAKLRAAEDMINSVAPRAARGGYFGYRIFDVTDPDGWRALAHELEDAGIIPDVLINNEGGADAVRRVTELNFLSQVYAAEIMLPLIMRSPRGAIVNVSSSASLCALPGCAAYSASKAASRAFTEALASEYRGRLYITSVCPGFTKTPIFDQQKPEIAKFLRFSASPEQMAKKILRGISRGQSLIIRGADAHAMSAVYRIAGTAGEGLCASILRIFGGTAFSECFEKTE